MRSKRKIAVIAAILAAVVCASVVLVFIVKEERANRENAVTMRIVPYGPFTITNGEGRQLTWKDGKLSGNMRCYSWELVSNNSWLAQEMSAPQLLVLEIPASTAYTYEPESERFWCGLSAPDDFPEDVSAPKRTGIRVCGKNLDQLIYTTEDGVTLTGEAIDYTLLYTPALNIASMEVALYGKAEGSVRFFWSNTELYTEGIQGRVRGCMEPYNDYFYFTGDVIIDSSNAEHPATPR